MNRTVDWDGDAIAIIDQTLLPGEEKLLRLHDVDQLAEAIRSLRVRGAPALGVVGALGIALAVRGATDVESAANRAAKQLAATRPTAVNLSWGIEQACLQASKGAGAVLRAALELIEADVRTNRAMAQRGADWIAATTAHPVRVLTHCNTGALACVEIGTALGVIAESFRRGLVEEVLATETRPLLQGSRLTAWELKRLGIPFRLVADGAAASVIAHGDVGLVMVGADRIAANGDVANKIGTFPLALAAARAKVPFAVVAPESTRDPSTSSGAEIQIEERDEEEVLGFAGTRVAPHGAHAINPAFDVTPADLVTAIITEDRIIEPASIGG